MLHADLHPQQETLIRPPEKGAFLFAEKDRGDVRNVREDKSRQNMYYIKLNGGFNDFRFFQNKIRGKWI